jgi:FimV-like protein
VRAMNEPYFSFTLDLIDNGNAFTKEFTGLLDLLPATDSGSYQATPLTGTKPTSADVRSLDSSVNPNAMGPYDWAKSGQMPKAFGAVLDGQSLWRVARRINTAMDVSLNQMMWALYEGNPNAFATDSITSLHAGVFLSIAYVGSVSRTSDAEAKGRLDQLRGKLGSSAVVRTDDDQQLPDRQGLNNGKTETVDQSSIVASEVNSSSFQLTGLDQTSVDNSPSNSPVNDQSQRIISSLAQTVGNLTQELIRKDKQILFLEEKVAALEALASQRKSDSADLNALPANEDQLRSAS